MMESKQEKKTRSPQRDVVLLDAAQREAIIKRVLDGETMRMVGADYDISPGRVHLVLKQREHDLLQQQIADEQNGVASSPELRAELERFAKPVSARRKEQYVTNRRAIYDRFVELRAPLPLKGYEQIALELGVSVRHLYKVVAEFAPKQAKASPRRRATKTPL